MKALRYYARKDIRYEDAPEPFPALGQAKIEVNMAGICGSDLFRYVLGPTAAQANQSPTTMGHEFAGTIVALGSNVPDFKIGDRVTGLGYWYCGECSYCQKGMFNLCSNRVGLGAKVNGCMAEYVIAPVNTLFKLPDSVSDELGAMVEPLSVAIHAVNQGNVHPGDTVAVVGLGPIGLCALAAAKAAGASEVYGIEKIQSRIDLARVLGATAVVPVAGDNPIDVLKNMTHGQGVDIGIECVGHTLAPLETAVSIVRRGGTIVLTGLFDQPVPFNFGTITFTEKTLSGSTYYTNESETAIAWLADKRPDISRLITSIIPLEDAVKLGFEKLINDKEENIKILLRIG